MTTRILDINSAVSRRLPRSLSFEYHLLTQHCAQKSECRSRRLHVHEPKTFFRKEGSEG